VRIHLPFSLPLYGANSSSVIAVTSTTPPVTRPLVPGVHAVGVPGIGNLPSGVEKAM